jgi:hypothetical protein
VSSGVTNLNGPLGIDIKEGPEYGAQPTNEGTCLDQTNAKAHNLSSPSSSWFQLVLCPQIL